MTTFARLAGATQHIPTDRVIDGLDQTALREMVRKELPGSIYRCKGIVYTADQRKRRVVLQCVGRRTDVELGELWNGTKPRTKIVAIGERDGFDPDDLQRRFEACLSAWFFLLEFSAISKWVRMVV